MGAAPSLEELAKSHNDDHVDFDSPESWRLDHVRALKKHFTDGNYDFGMDRETFDRFFAEGLPAAAEATGSFWRKFDTNGSRLINALELLTGLSIMSMGTLEEKADLVFELNDLNGRGSLSYDELVVLLYLSAASTVLASGKGVLPEEHAMEAIADEAFVAADVDLTGSIDRSAFTTWLEDFLGITEETPAVGLREFLKRMKSLKHAKVGSTPGADIAE